MGDMERASMIVAATDRIPAEYTAERPELVIAADGGLDAVLAAGWVPDIIVGDLDSAEPSAIDAAAARGAVVDRHPAAKDESDLELALAVARDRAVDVVHVIVRDGGRLDHQLANLAALAAPELAAMQITATIGRHRVWVVRETRTLDLDVGDHLAIQPIGGPAFVTTTGVAYPLDAEVLSPFEARGIANRVLDRPTIDVGSGVVLAISSPAETA